MVILPDENNTQIMNIIDGEKYLYDYDEFEESIIVRSVIEMTGMPAFAVYGVSFETIKLALHADENYFLDSYINGKWEKDHLNLFLKFFRPEISEKYKLLFT